MVSQDVDSSVRSINDPKVTVRDKTNFMAGFNIHLGYKVIEDGVLYAIAGYKYLKSNTSINFDFEAEYFFDKERKSEISSKN